MTESSKPERARKNRGRLANTPCLFNARHHDHDDVDFAPSAHEDDEQEEYFAPTTAGEGVQFWPWVNKVSNKRCFALGLMLTSEIKTPMTVSPDLPLEIVMQFFKRLG
jgi:chloride channel 3/4/5